MTTRHRRIFGLLLLVLIPLAGCGGPAAIEGKVTITSTEPFKNMKAHKSKEPGHKPPA